MEGPDTFDGLSLALGAGSVTRFAAVSLGSCTGSSLGGAGQSRAQSSCRKWARKMTCQPASQPEMVRDGKGAGLVREEEFGVSKTRKTSIIDIESHHLAPVPCCHKHLNLKT